MKGASAASVWNEDYEEVVQAFRLRHIPQARSEGKPSKVNPNSSPQSVKMRRKAVATGSGHHHGIHGDHSIQSQDRRDGQQTV